MTGHDVDEVGVRVRVLVVSEDAVERLRAVSALRLHTDLDVEVVEADSGPDARRLLAEEPAFDVLVLDGDLRPKGGFALLYALRSRAELEGQSQPPAVILAGREQDRWLADWAGANAVLVKPVASFPLAREVESLVGVGGADHGATESSDQIADLVTTAKGDSAGLNP